MRETELNTLFYVISNVKLKRAERRGISRSYVLVFPVTHCNYGQVIFWFYCFRVPNERLDFGATIHQLG